ncbi:ubiquitin-conjugating enzyme E2 D4-like [Drosophila miranda]|uniref:ubiquitin-conjugating enzyme E2 D4-like n=1 Tax=Drosophila miranda TaxID=7229 RepID=UPI00143F9BA4|nr:ubiquitin-conjugating enzyme E2 D4-like [Drosophila miranda]
MPRVPRVLLRRLRIDAATGAPVAARAPAATQGTYRAVRDAVNPNRNDAAEPANAGPRDATQENGFENDIGRCRIRKELAKMLSKPTEGCTVELVDGSIYTWSAVILGPSNTPYEGGHFSLEIRFPLSYPFKPPMLTFRTKVYHCNIDNGNICVDILSSAWSPSLTVEKILLSIQSLLSDPNCDSPLNSAAAVMYKKDREQYDRLAREWTDRFAKPVAPTPPQTPPQ